MSSLNGETDELDDEDELDEDDDQDEKRRELFPFRLEESFVVYELKSLVRKILQRPTLSGSEVRQVGTVLFALERLPRPTPGVAVGLGVAYRYNNESTYCELFISESEFRLSNGGNTYDPGVGSDSYSQTIFEMETSGFREGSGDDYEVTGWFNSINELLTMESSIDIEYLGDDEAVDWSEEGSEDFWEDLEEN